MSLTPIPSQTLPQTTSTNMLPLLLPQQQQGVLARGAVTSPSMPSPSHSIAFGGVGGNGMYGNTPGMHAWNPSLSALNSPTTTIPASMPTNLNLMYNNNNDMTGHLPPSMLMSMPVANGPIMTPQQ
uniref:Isoleucine--tRNA ligase n=1 Tax=Lygus hesperus TaxID=30085 RepID=A0A0A9YP40_LYGHE